jgi:hypothetical protein
VQLLHKQIPKAQKDTQLKHLFVLSGSAGVKAERKQVNEIEGIKWQEFLLIIYLKLLC